MIEIRGAKTIGGTITDHFIPSQKKAVINAENLLLFPAGIDPHVHFRVPGQEYKEDWKTAARAAIHGGMTTVFDMPNNIPPCTTYERLLKKKQKIDEELKETGIQLRYYLYFGAQKDSLEEIVKSKDEIIGIKVFMGSSTGELLIDDDDVLAEIFKIAKSYNLLIAVHAEDEKLIKERKKLFAKETAMKTHSLLRNPEVAESAVKKAIDLCRKFGCRLYILHVSSALELKWIKEAKKEGLPVYAEATPHHLFLNDAEYDFLQGKALVNPPLRAKSDQLTLWNALADGIIDTIGSDHAPHTMEEKRKPLGLCPSGMPGIETTLPLLFNAYHEGKISLSQIASLTSINAGRIFNLPPSQDVLLVDLEMEKTVEESHLKTKVKWSPFSGKKLKGWPVYTFLGEEIFKLG